jgi:hypothetical protein
MNYLLLPQELQNLIGEFNVDHRPKMNLVFNELLLNHENIIYNDNHCRYCHAIPDEKFTKTILWKKYKKYKFCSGWCSFNYGYDLIHT